MSIPWYEREPNVEATLRAELAEKYPDLRLTVSGQAGELRGSFPILHDGVELDRFQLEIHVPAGFPKESPVAFEVGGRVPHAPDWHVSGDGSLCVGVPEEWLLNRNSRSLIAYLDGPLRNFFISHALAEAGKPRPMGERQHGTAGLLEFYGEMVGTTAPNAILRYLDCCAAKKVRRHWLCPCGSGKRVVECHLSHVNALRARIPRPVAAQAFERLKKSIEADRLHKAATGNVGFVAGSNRAQL